MFFSLRSRLMLVFIVLLIIPFIVLSLVIPGQFIEIMEDQIETSTVQTMDQYTLYINSITTQAEEIGKQVLVNDITQQFSSMQDGNQSLNEHNLIIKNKLKKLLISIMMNNSNGISISVFRNDGTSTWSNDPSFLNSSWFKDFSVENHRWLTAHKDPYHYYSSNINNSYLLPLIDMNTFEQRGIIKINFPTALLEDALNKIELGETGRIYLMNWQGENVLQQEVLTTETVLEKSMKQIKSSSAVKGMVEISDAGEGHLIFFQKLKVGDWVLIGEVPKGELFSAIHRLQRSLLLGSGFLFFLTILASFWLSSNIARPLAKLTKAMGFIERGEFTEAKRFMPTIRSYNSEVGYVIKVFSQMVKRLKHLIETQFEANIRRQNAEYKALLLQINPHFMNNTLEIIGGLAAQERNKEVMDISVSLGRMMRYSLNTQSDLVKLSDEMNYIRHFTDILKLRYEDDISFVIEEDPLTKDIQIIKFILQPLVENAVKYSFESKKYAKIRIAAVRSSDGLLIEVEDNGAGMSQQVISELLEEERENDSISVLGSSGRSIGLRNVLGRLKLYYGNQFWYDIQSHEHAGTKITLCIKLAEKRDYPS